MASADCATIPVGKICMANETIGLTDLQQELLKLYGNRLSEKSLLEIKTILARYFADKASDGMDEVCEERSLDAQDMYDWSNGHDRTENRP